MPNPGDRIKHYEIEKLLGKGGMGEVYLAQDTKLDRKVAIKFLPPELESDELTQTRFIREAKAAAALDHPFICKVYESGETDGISYIVMEYIEGQTLGDRMKSKPLSLNESLRIALEIAEAIEKAHKEGIIHRDLKPPNIMLTPQEHVKVMDFGLAKKIMPSGGNLEQTLTQASITEKGTIAGTLAYMSPEQAKGNKLDGRSDIFSLGIIIYEMFSHKHPFSKTTPIETLSAILRDPPPTPNVKPKTINPILRPILKKAMAKKPDDRYQSISELVSDLRKAQRHAHGGTRLPLQGIPLYIASAAIVAVMATGVFFLAKRPAATPKAQPDPISVLIADFQNKTNDPVFDGSLEHALTIGLEEAPFITAFRRDNARRLANKLDSSADNRLDIRLATLVCVQEGINVVIDGSIEKTNKGYVFRIIAIDPFSSEEIDEFSKTTSTKAEVLGASIELANKLISGLGGRAIDSIKAIAEETLTSSSLEAVNAYTRAQSLYSLGKTHEAISEYLRVIELAPSLGPAYSGLTRIYFNLGDRQKAEEYHKQALAHIANMTDREKYRTRIMWYLLTRDFQRAIEEGEALVSQFPSDSAGHGNLALAYFYARNMPKAFEHGQKTVELYPKDVNAHYNVSWYAIAAGNFDLARQEANKVLELDLSMEKAYLCLGISELAQGLNSEAAENYMKLKTFSFFGSSMGTIGLADIALYEGRMTNAKEMLERGIEVDLENKRPDLAAIKFIMQAHAHLLLGEKDLALKAADQAIDLYQELNVSIPAAQIYIEAGKTDKAKALMDKLNELFESEPRAYAKLIEGEINRKNGRIKEAIVIFNESQELLDT